MSLGCRSLDLPHLAPQGKWRVTGQRPPHPSLLGLDHHTQLSLYADLPIKSICALCGLCPCSCLSSWSTKLFMLALSTCHCSGLGMYASSSSLGCTAWVIWACGHGPAGEGWCVWCHITELAPTMDKDLLRSRLGRDREDRHRLTEASLVRARKGQVECGLGGGKVVGRSP